MTKSIKEKIDLKQIRAFEKGEIPHLNSNLIKIKLICGFGYPSQYKELLEDTNDFDHIASHIKMISY